MLLTLLFACNQAADTYQADLTDAAEATCAEALDITIVGRFEDPLPEPDLEISVCLPSGWDSYQVPADQLPQAFADGGYWGNFDVSPPDFTHTIEGEETQANAFVWNMVEYDPWGEGTLKEGVETFRDNESDSDTAEYVTKIEQVEVSHYTGYAFVEAIASAEDDQWSFPGVTAIYLYIDLNDGWVLDLTGFMGSASVIEIGSPTSPRNDWPAPLAAYWEAVGATIIVSAP